jgi:L-ascorbate oxidase
MLRKLLAGGTTALCLSAAAALPVSAAPFREPTVFASASGVLNLLMIAESRPNPSLAAFYPGTNGQGPESWVYRICQDPPADAMDCPAGSSVAEYGGVRLALNRGGKLKIRLVNNLPVSNQFKNAALLGTELFLNPTNLHTHGLLVEPRVPTQSRPTYGDNIFVLTYNPLNGFPSANTTHNHGDIREGFTDYEIDIPADHPLGSFWFHPHAHGVALNQVSAGLSGIITIGQLGDYACADAACTLPLPEAQVRHLILKDTQIEQDPNSGPSGLLSTQEDPQFCDSSASAGAGWCAGQSVPGGADHTGGKWFFPVSGQVNPLISMTAPDGETWRITNSSGSVSYNLHLTDNASNQDMIFQVLAVDGVTVNPDVATTPGQMVQLGGGKFRVVSCPGSTAGMTRQPVCTSSLTMFPSSRVEIWVTYRDGQGNLATPAPGASATFKTAGFQTGATGDSWPPINLANLEFKPSGPRTFTSDFVNLRPGANILLGSGGLFETPAVPSTTTAPTANCAPLPAGYHRRIFYGVPDQGIYPGVGFGLGYEVIDDKGAVVPGTTVDITPFDPNVPIVCVPLSPGNLPVKEVWELINTATEDHNFHIHQTKFRVVDLKAQPGSPLYAVSLFVQSLISGLSPRLAPAGQVLHDNIRLPSATGNCNGIADWRSGACSSTPVVLEIPFKYAGDFVYHCHILEHEDGGMMAKIRVASNP